jgi:hypothetical protein
MVQPENAIANISSSTHTKNPGKTKLDLRRIGERSSCKKVVKKLSKSCQKVVKKLSKSLKSENKLSKN